MLVTAVFMLVLAGVGRSDEPLKVSMQVLYESRCPDSRAFMVNQLQPTMKLLHDQIELKLVPFGKARSIEGGHGGFQCQHGSSECQGNLVQECALDLMANRSDLEKTAYVVCEMRTYSGALGSFECVREAQVPVKALNKCITSGRGTALQLKSERITKQYKPNYIPTVIIDGVFNQQVQYSSQEDLTGTLCTILKHTGKCAQAPRRSNPFAIRYLYV